MGKLDTFDLLVTLPKTTGDRYDKTKHLKEKIAAIRNDGIAWWDLRREPAKWSQEKVFVVCDGSLWGYFTVNSVSEEHDDLRIYFDEWIPIKLIQMKGFQGFRYMKIPYETFKHDFDTLSDIDDGGVLECKNCDYTAFLRDPDPDPPCTKPKGRELL